MSAERVSAQAGRSATAPAKTRRRTTTTAGRAGTSAAPGRCVTVEVAARPQRRAPLGTTAAPRRTAAGAPSPAARARDSTPAAGAASRISAAVRRSPVDRPNAGRSPTAAGGKSPAHVVDTQRRSGRRNHTERRLARGRRGTCPPDPAPHVTRAGLTLLVGPALSVPRTASKRPRLATDGAGRAPADLQGELRPLPVPRSRWCATSRASHKYAPGNSPVPSSVAALT